MNDALKSFFLYVLPPIELNLGGYSTQVMGVSMPAVLLRLGVEIGEEFLRLVAEEVSKIVKGEPVDIFLSTGDYERLKHLQGKFSLLMCSLLPEKTVMVTFVRSSVPFLQSLEDKKGDVSYDWDALVKFAH